LEELASFFFYNESIQLFDFSTARFSSYSVYATAKNKFDGSKKEENCLVKYRATTGKKKKESN
jgi:hypothetical protein